MGRIHSLNPERILWCCQEFSITVEELARQAGISQNSLDAALQKGKGLTFKQLQTLADIFNRGVLFFAEPEPAIDTNVYTPQFRTIANQKPEITPKLRSLVERVEQHRDIYLALREDLGDTKNDRFRSPKVPLDNLKNAAEITRKWLGLEQKNSFATYRAAIEEKGLLVFRSNRYAGKWQIAKDEPICGFTIYDSKCPVIVVKKFDSPSKQAFTLMHELGHVLLHKSSFIDEESDLWLYQGNERDANYFASYLLMPDTFMKKLCKQEFPSDYRLFDEWLQPYCKAWGISSYVILIRLVNAGYLKQHQYDSYDNWKKEQPKSKREGGNRQFRFREPRSVFGEPYVRTVLDALNSKQISLVTASNYLDNLKITDLHKLESSYADS